MYGISILPTKHIADAMRDIDSVVLSLLCVNIHQLAGLLLTEECVRHPRAEIRLETLSETLNKHQILTCDEHLIRIARVVYQWRWAIDRCGVVEE